MSAGRKLFGEGKSETQYFRSSFRQLSDIQQRQVGLILGAVVADAAVRGVSLRLEHHQQPQDHNAAVEVAGVSSSAASLGSPILSADEEHQFATLCSDPSRMIGEEALIELDPVFLSSPTTIGEALPSSELRTQSFTAMLLHELVHFLATSSLSKSLLHNEAELPNTLQRCLVGPRWAAAAKAHPVAFERWQGSLLHTTAALLPLPCVYPWADDDALRRFSIPFTELLSSSSSSSSKEEEKEALSAVNGAGTTADDLLLLKSEDERAEVLEDCAVATLGAGLRCLQSNPDAIKNAALQAMGRTALSAQWVGRVFPSSSSSLSETATHPPYSPHSLTGGFQTEALALHEALCITQRSRSYAHGIRLLLQSELMRGNAASLASSPSTAAAHWVKCGGSGGGRRGGVFLCQQAMVVGALLGAKYGVRTIPVEWLTATPRHVPLTSMAIELSQWSWNPGQ